VIKKEPSEFTATYYNLRQTSAFTFTGSDITNSRIYPKPKQHVYHEIDKMKNTIKPFSFKRRF
jgi:hypothetical protein